MRPLLGLLATGVVALVVAGCGGADGQASEKELEEALSSLEEELAENPPGPGLGEGSPPPPDASLWKTDFSKQLVPLEEFLSGGPPKDGIPAIDEPRFLKVANVSGWIADREPVIAVTVGKVTRAYPIQILMWHEIVNDTIGTTPVAVTFCPLCNTAIVFERRVKDVVTTFGTTGKLRNSDLVMYDRKTESWWQQFSGEALVGELAGEKLEQVPARMMAWEEFRETYPNGFVLSQDTGFLRNYGVNPYVGYDSIDSSPLFATRNEDDDRLPPKERVAYVEVGERAIAVPFPSLKDKGTVTIETDSGELVVRWKPGVASALDNAGIDKGRDVGAATVTLAGKPYPFHEPFWFAVAAFRPDIEIVDG